MLIHKDSFDWMKERDADSIDHIITDPPYLINFMNKGWDKEDNIAGSVEFWKEALRVCKTGSYALVFGHSRTFHRVMIAMEDAGWEIRDTILWLYGQGFPKNKNLGDGWGSALKPAYEPIIMARKPFKGSLENNNKTNGLGGLNIDECRVGTEVMPALETKTEITEIGWEKKGYTTPERTGRHPANVILSHSEGCVSVGVKEEITLNHNAPKGTFAGGEQGRGSEKVYREQKNKIELYECEEGCPVKMLDEQAPKTGNGHRAKVKIKGYGKFGGGTETYEGVGEKMDGLGGASRFFYCPKVSTSERNETSNKNNHPTVKPIKLMEYLVKMVSREGQVILDPFAGSGSTGVACINLKRHFILVEKDDDYLNIIKARTENARKKAQTTEEDSCNG